MIYRCNKKYVAQKCLTPHVTEDEIKAAFVSAFNQLLSEKAEIIANAELIRDTVCQTDALEEEKRALENEMSVVADMAQGLIAENARIAQNQEEYQKRYDGLIERYNAAKTRYGEVSDTINAKKAESERLADFINNVPAQEGVLTEFDEQLWSCMVEFVTVGRKKEFVVTFRDGTEVMV